MPRKRKAAAADAKPAEDTRPAPRVDDSVILDDAIYKIEYFGWFSGVDVCVLIQRKHPHRVLYLKTEKLVYNSDAKMWSAEAADLMADATDPESEAQEGPAPEPILDATIANPGDMKRKKQNTQKPQNTQEPQTCGKCGHPLNIHVANRAKRIICLEYGCTRC